jgi:hypothetical protein
MYLSQKLTKENVLNSFHELGYVTNMLGNLKKRKVKSKESCSVTGMHARRGTGGIVPTHSRPRH